MLTRCRVFSTCFQACHDNANYLLYMYYYVDTHCVLIFDTMLTFIEYIHIQWPTFEIGRIYQNIESMQSILTYLDLIINQHFLNIRMIIWTKLNTFYWCTFWTALLYQRGNRQQRSRYTRIPQQAVFDTWEKI